MPDSGQPARPARPGAEIVHSVCPHDCPSTCALEVERLDARTIGAVRGAGANSYTQGVICAKVARYAERIHHPGRLLRPLRRTGARGDGQFVEISWDDALDEVANAFLRATQKYDTTAVWPYYFAGTMGLVQRDGINRLRHVMRYSGLHKTICTSIVDAGWTAGVGAKTGVDPREMEHSDLIVMWGGNPVNTQVNVMTHVAHARKTRGAKFIVVDPYRTGTAAMADMHLMVRPGTDGALACAVMHVLFRDGHADRDYLAKHTDFPAGLEAHLKSRDPAWAERITGVPAAQIEDFAALYGRTKNAYLRVGYGFARSRNGATNTHAVACLPAVTGAWKYKGGGAHWSYGSIYRWNKTLIEGLDARDPSIRVLDMSRLGAILTGDKRDLGDGPPVAAMIVQNTNPAVVCPDSHKVRRGLMRDDLFTCVHEQFMTETAKLADIVLPATMFLEHDDVYQAGGHPHIQIGAKVVEPPGECRSNHDVLCGLAKRLGAQHRGFEMSAWQMIDETLKDSGWPGAAEIQAKHWHDVIGDFETSHFLKGFPTNDGRFHFAPDWSKLGANHAAMPKLPDHFDIVEKADSEHPFRLVAAPARQFLNTSFTETPTARKREVRPTLLLHPKDAASLGIADGMRARIGNRRGEIALHAKLFEGLQRGVVVVESIWPNADFADGIGINALIGDDPAPPNGGAVFHDTAIWVRPAESTGDTKTAALADAKA